MSTDSVSTVMLPTPRSRGGRHDTAAQPPRARVLRALERVGADGHDAHALHIDDAEALLGARSDELESLLNIATRLRNAGAEARGDATGNTITYSRKVFIPLTTLCRDRCHYCTFVDTPGALRREGREAYLSPEQVLEIARAGAAAGCKEALFTLGDRPEDRWQAARDWLTEHGYASTIDYVAAMAKLVLQETGLLPHVNPGVMSWAEIQRLRAVSPSMGMMLETTSTELWSEPGGAHFGSPDKDPALRLRVIEDAGRSRIPFTTGILLGIGETLRDRAESLFAIRAAHARWGHVQEVIVQNFRAKPRTAMQNEPDLETQQYIAAVAVARLVMGPEAHIQAPPNLTDPHELALLIRAGIDDWGGVSPLTPDHVNPERPWPHVSDLASLTSEAGFDLRERLTAHPRWVRDPETWIDPGLHDAVASLAGESGLAATSQNHRAHLRRTRFDASGISASLIDRAANGTLSDDEWTRLLTADGTALDDLAAAADESRRRAVGDEMTFAVNRNLDASLYDPTGARGGLGEAELRALASEALAVGATEVCVQGTLHASLPGAAAFDLIESLHDAAPELHLHAFRAAEVRDTAQRLGISPSDVYRELRERGVGSVPGTAAFILDDRIRAALTGGTAMTAAEWLRLIGEAHRAGLRSTATMVYGHIEEPHDVIAHLRALKKLQDETGGFTEFIPMPLMPADVPLPPETRAMLRDAARSHGTELPGGALPVASPRTSRAIHAVSRLLLAGSIDHIQAAWTKLGVADATRVLAGGADDLGGLLLNSAISPAADPEHGRSLSHDDVTRLAAGLDRKPRQRTTLYGSVTQS